METIYLDYNASTPLLPEIVQAMKPFLEDGFGNPSSSHVYGQRNKRALEQARRQLADLINAQPEEIIFTSGGSESNNMAIKGIAELRRSGHIITSSFEHPAVLEVCRYLEKHNFDVSYIPVDEFGLIDPANIEKALRTDTILISIMLANNEVGTLEPIAEIAAIARQHHIPLHTDAAQAVGKLHVDVRALGVDMLSIAGHKMHAPKGIGALYLRNGLTLPPLIHGAGHEQGLRAGTENVLEIVGLGAAAESFGREELRITGQIRKLRDLFEQELRQALGDVRINGHPDLRLVNTSNLYFPGIDANTLLSAIPAIAASAGAACHADSVTPSYVLKAMGFDNERALSSIRFSIGRSTTEDEIRQAVKIISSAASRLSVKSSKPVFIETDDVRLTQFTHGLGCACKIRPQNLEKILHKLATYADANIQVSFENSDDAAVYRLNDETSLVSTVDFFTPIVDDPYDFGRIAAANALSDIYAMGARPLFALNIVAFPEKRLPMEVLERILLGAHSIAAEAGIPILGGHSVEDNEPKFGWAVTGTIHPEKILKNNGARIGDVLILTKPIGLGILTTALKRKLLSDQTRERIIRLMVMLNQKAASIASEYPVHACTDITGFGLLGHLSEMMSPGDNAAIVQADQVPLIEETIEMARLDAIPGGTQANFDFITGKTEWSSTISRLTKLILCDAQTSGGLLIAVPEAQSQSLLDDLHRNGVPEAALIGRVVKGKNSKIIVVR